MLFKLTAGFRRIKHAQNGDVMLKGQLNKVWGNIREIPLTRESKVKLKRTIE
jgi:hypothetical protein